MTKISLNLDSSVTRTPHDASRALQTTTVTQIDKNEFFLSTLKELCFLFMRRSLGARLLVSQGGVFSLLNTMVEA